MHDQSFSSNPFSTLSVQLGIIPRLTPNMATPTSSKPPQTISNKLRMLTYHVRLPSCMLHRQTLFALIECRRWQHALEGKISDYLTLKNQLIHFSWLACPLSYVRMSVLHTLESLCSGQLTKRFMATADPFSHQQGWVVSCVTPRGSSTSQLTTNQSSRRHFYFFVLFFIFFLRVLPWMGCVCATAYICQCAQRHSERKVFACKTISCNCVRT